MMVSTERIIQKLIGKPSFRLSNEVPPSYLFRVALDTFIGRVRGFMRFLTVSGGYHAIVDQHVKLRCKHRISLGKNVRIGAYVELDALSQDGIKLGDNVKIGSRSRIIGSGSLAELGKGISIGDGTNFSDDSFFGCAGGITIGENVIAGQNVRFHAENHKFDDMSKPIRYQGVTHQGIKVGNNVWIGAGVVFLDGVSVSDGCVIGANAVLTGGNFPKNSVIVGVPARVIKKRSE